MLEFGVVMLVHTALDRAAQVARHWARGGCPVVIHVDRIVGRADYEALRAALSDCEHVHFSRRHRCEWGTWGIIRATQDATVLMLRRYRKVEHVYLASGACLPLRPVADLAEYLAARRGTDFIESATIAEVPWTVGGLDRERFTLFFPFSWRRHRWLFDRFVALQRALGVRRELPAGIVPHLGSQWWCLSRRTLVRLLDDPERATFERYFRHVWIPDECYFQTLVRRYSGHVESRSLTLSKFDHQGRPHIFYDDHLSLLRRSGCFVARKIWPRADRLYDTFLSGDVEARGAAEPDPARIDRIFARALERRTRGRPGLYMQSRFPRPGRENGLTAAPYAVFQGFSDLFEDFEAWLARHADVTVHGHLFAPGAVEFAGRERVFAGALSDSAAIRDANPRAFLTNLLWNTRGSRQCFQFGPGDRREILPFIADDPNAEIAVIAGAWALSLWRSGRSLEELRPEAARLQQVEARMLDLLRGPGTKARVRIWSLAEFLDAPIDNLREAVAGIAHREPLRVAEAPTMVSLEGFGSFLQALKNLGMHPYLMGEFPAGAGAEAARARQLSRPYVVR